MDRPPVQIITSAQNPRLRQTARLRDRSPRDEAQQFLIEGYRCVRRALEGGQPITELFICPELYQGVNEPQLVADCQARGARVFQLPPHLFGKLAYRDRPEGLLGVAPQRHLRLDDLPAGDPPFLVVAEAIEKPGNLGTILRSADATGVDGLILCDRCTDLFNPNVVRASTGTLFSVPVAECTTAEALDWLRARHVRILAATPHAQTVFTETDMRGPLAIVVGSEQYGLSEGWLGAADAQVRIPMLGMADSLNVATATTLLLYEVARQRGFPSRRPQ